MGRDAASFAVHSFSLLRVVIFSSYYIGKGDLSLRWVNAVLVSAKGMFIEQRQVDCSSSNSGNTSGYRCACMSAYATVHLCMQAREVGVLAVGLSRGLELFRLPRTRAAFLSFRQ